MAILPIKQHAQAMRVNHCPGYTIGNSLMNNLNTIDFAGIEQAAKPNISNLLERILPEGKHSGKYYKCADINGGAGNSFSYNTENGLWADFETSEIKGNGIIALVAMQKNISQSEAAKIVASLAGYNQGNASLRNNFSRAINQETCKEYKGKWINGEPDLSDYFFSKFHRKHCYKNLKGETIGYVLITIKGSKDGKASYKKTALPLFRFPDGKWYFGRPEGLRSFYGVEKLAKMAPDCKIIIMEGEHKTDLLQSSLGENYAVLSISGGCNGINKMDFEPLKDLSLVYWPDNDKSGVKAAIEFHSLAIKKKSTVKLIMPPADKPEAWDAGNAVEEGWVKKEIELFIETCSKDLKEFEDIVCKRWGLEKTVGTKQRGRILNLDEIFSAKAPEREWLLYPVLQKGKDSILYGAAGTGKTLLALTMGLTVATGGAMLDGRWKADRQWRVCYVDGEMEFVDSQARIVEIRRGLKADCPPENFRLFSQQFQTEDELCPDISTPEGKEFLWQFTQEADLIILDNLSSLTDISKENEAQFWQSIKIWALSMKRLGKAILFIDHANKAGTLRGTSSKMDAVSTSIEVKKVTDHEASEGCYFNVNFQKSRSVYGDAVKPFEAHYTAADNVGTWKTCDIEGIVQSGKEKQIEVMVSEGHTYDDIIKKLGVSRTTISKVKKAMQE